MIPSCDQTGVPGLVAETHFHSSTMSGSALLMSARILPRVFPRHPPSSTILFEMRSDPGWLRLAPDFFMYSSSTFRSLIPLRPTGGREQVGGCDCPASRGRPRRECRRPTESPHAPCPRSAYE